MAMELVPIGTILAVLTKQVIKTAQAAKDVLVEKNSFRVLSKHLFEIEPVLKELQHRELNDSQAARVALDSLEADVKRANILVEKYSNCGRFYLLVKCRHIVKEVQQVTRDIGRSLAALSLANAEVLTEISDQVHQLHSEMQRVKFEASHSQLQILDKLDRGIKDQKLDQGFANDMLEEIARAVGVSVEHSEISRELDSFRREKEEAASRKERAEELFLNQVIELLSRADAARDHEEVRIRYSQRVQAIELYDARDQEEFIPPLNAFLCPISRMVMVHPVSLSTGTSCERAAIEAWLDRGERVDPETGGFLHDTSLRPNLRLRQSIEEWRELNYCLQIRSCRAKLLSDTSSAEEALSQMQDLMRENSVNKDWISIAGLVDIMIDVLEGSHNKNVRRKVLITLKEAVEGHSRNKEQVVESKGWELIIPCLGRDSSTSKACVALLFELLQDRCGWNVPMCRKLSQQNSAILFLVTLLRSSVIESAEYAEKILNKLFDIDAKNISRAARSGWYKPLIHLIVQGPDSLRISSVRSLVDMELVDSSLEIIGKEGIIPPLLQMMSLNFESKELSLSALAKLLSCHSNKELFAAAGGVPCILGLLFTPHERTMIISRCCEILGKLTAGGNGIKFLVDGTGADLELERIITNLLNFPRNENTSQSVLKPALNTILGICRHEPEMVKKAVLTSNGIMVILPLLDNSDSDIREAAIILLFHFSMQEPEGVVEFLLRPRRLEALVGSLENEEKSDVQMAAAGLLANLPKSELSLTMKLIELEGLDALIKILRSGTMEAKENALSALFRFVDPMNMESQRIAVEKGLYPLLVNLLRVGSVTAKARAAALVGNLSSSSQKLSVSSQPRGCCCWCFRARVPSCSAHGGVCTVGLTFCLVEAKALPYLVELLKGEVHVAAYEAIQALVTLVHEGSPSRGANVLYRADAIRPALEILNWGTDSLKEEVLRFLEKIFLSREMVDVYGSTTKLILVGLTGRSIQEDGQLWQAASRVLALVERYSRSSTSIIPGLVL